MLKIRLSKEADSQSPEFISPFQFLWQWFVNFELSISLVWDSSFKFTQFCDLSQNFQFKVYSPASLKYFCTFALPLLDLDFQTLQGLFWEDLKQNTEEMVNYKFIDFQIQHKSGSRIEHSNGIFLELILLFPQYADSVLLKQICILPT